MRCKTCDYALWNIKTRQCPECGSAFKPTEYEFITNSVKFCCPHCDQAYYGTDQKGHLFPQAFNCVKCGAPVTMDEMVLRPAVGVEESQTIVDPMPWIERSRRGVVKAWFGTIGRSMVAPHRLMRGLPVESSVADAWWYAFLTMAAFLFMGAGLPILVFSSLMFARSKGNSVGMFIAGVVTVVVAPLLVLLLVALWGLVTHGMLKITGGCSYTIGRTYQALLYSVGANAPMAVPCFGPYCGYLLCIWCVVSACIMTTVGQKVHGGRATLAVLTLPAIFLALGVGSYAIFVYAVLSNRAAFGPTTAATAVTPMSEAQFMTQDLLTYRQTHNGQWPAHALQLVCDGVATGNFVSVNTLTEESDVPVADTTIDQFGLLGPNKQAIAAQAAADALPEGVIAHRVGDFVFTYHGLDPATHNGKLWIVVLASDPDINGAASDILAVGCLDGTFQYMRFGQIAQMLKDQNSMRAAQNLPPLPEPSTVTHDNPAN